MNAWMYCPSTDEGVTNTRVNKCGALTLGPAAGFAMLNSLLMNNQTPLYNVKLILGSRRRKLAQWLHRRRLTTTETTHITRDAYLDQQ